jgi:hypothetical protein
MLIGHGWTETHGFFALMGGFMAFNGDTPVQTLLPEQLAGYSLSGKGHFPCITTDEIQDRSKGDIVSKGLVVLQTGWFIIQSITRWIRGLPLTQLELVTIAFAILNFVVYWLWWNKPLNVHRAVRVYRIEETTSPVTNEDVGEIAEGEHRNFRYKLCLAGRYVFRLPMSVFGGMKDGIRKHGWKVVLVPCELLFRITGMQDHDVGLVEEDRRVSTFYPKSAGQLADIAEGAVVAFAGTLFGAMHCIAWSFAFPSDTERHLWHIASISITVCPLAFILFGFLLHFLFPNGRVFWGCLNLIFLTYVVSRLFLIFLPFLSLRALPPDIYQSVQWTMIVPHL